MDSATENESKQKNFLRRAIELAGSNVGTGRGGPFGAVIARDGELIAEALNTVLADNDPTAHAEVNAIRRACRTLNTFDLSGCELLSSCEPCPMCLGAANWARISRIVYGAASEDAARAGFDDSDLYRQFCLPREQRDLPSIAVLREEAWQPFAAWLKQEKVKRY